MELLGAPPPTGHHRVPPPRIVDRVNRDPSQDYDQQALWSEETERLVRRFPGTWFRVADVEHDSVASRWRARGFHAVQRRTGDRWWVYAMARKPTGRVAELRRLEARLPAPPPPTPQLQLPELDMTDSGFCWAKEELEQATRTARQWLFPVGEEEA